MTPEPTSDTVECETLFGKTKRVPSDKLFFRPAAYALVEHDGNVLLVMNQHVRKWYLPGGGVHVGEMMQDAARREVAEETGIAVAVGEFLYFRESFFYHDPLDVAVHALSFVYRATPLTFTISGKAPDNPDEGNPQWVPLAQLQPDDLHGITTRIFEFVGC